MGEPRSELGTDVALDKRRAVLATPPPGAGREEQLDFIAQAQHIRAEHDATHGEAEMCGGECIVLGLTDDDEAAPGAGSSPDLRSALEPIRLALKGARGLALDSDEPALDVELAHAIRALDSLATPPPPDDWYDPDDIALVQATPPPGAGSSPDLRSALDDLTAAYGAYAGHAEGAGTFQPRVIQRLVEAVFEALRAALATSPPASGLDVERLGFDDLLTIAEQLLTHYPPDTIVCSHSERADIGARTVAAIADLVSSSRAALAEEPPA